MALRIANLGAVYYKLMPKLLCKVKLSICSVELMRLEGGTLVIICRTVVDSANLALYECLRKQADPEHITYVKNIIVQITRYAAIVSCCQNAGSTVEACQMQRQDGRCTILSLQETWS